MADQAYMERALALARGGRGAVSPNPLVGAVIVKQGRIIGEGFHRGHGLKHAEIEALENAGESVEGATLYCNLEPCSCSYPGKKQPPCVNRVIKEKLARVVVANRDPNPWVNGKGIELLRQSGIEVTTGILKTEGARLNEAFFTYTRTGKPFVALKIAQSLDGRIATQSGHSQWITDARARRLVHKTRASFDAVLVGINTVRQDDPALTVRMVSGRDPWRIVLDSKLSIPLQAKLISPPFLEKTMIFTTQNSDQDKRETLAARGVQVFMTDATPEGHVNLNAVLTKLGAGKISSVLVEGGGEIFTSFIRQRLFDKLSIFMAPLIIGKGIEAVGELGTERIDAALRLRDISMKTIDHQVLVEGYREQLSFIEPSFQEQPCSQVL